MRKSEIELIGKLLLTLANYILQLAENKTFKDED